MSDNVNVDDPNVENSGDQNEQDEQPTSHFGRNYAESDDDESDEDDTAPFAANEENTQLDKEIKRKRIQLTKVETDVEDVEERVRVMNSHLKNVQQELSHTENLYDARKKECDAEVHMQTIAETEAARLAKDIRVAKTELENIIDELNRNENQIFLSNQRMGEIQDEMEWNKQELSAWLEKQQQVDEDNQMLEKYKRADETRIKDLTLKIDKLTTAQQKARNLLEKEVTETHSNQMKLDKLALAFQRVHKERQEVLRRLEETITKMQQRDSEIEDAAGQFLDLKHQTNEKMAEVKGQEVFLDEQKQNNNEGRKEIEMLERQATKLRADHLRAEKALENYRDEVASLRNTLAKVSSDLNQKKRLVTTLKSDVVTKKKNVERLKTELEEAKADRDDVSKRKLSAEETANQLDAMIEEEERQEKMILKEIEVLKKDQYKQTEAVHKGQKQEQLLQAQIQGLAAANKNLDSHSKKLDAEAVHQQQLLYQQDFQIAALERKYAKLEGKQTKEEKRESEQKIAELNFTLEQHRKTAKLLKQQVRQSETDLRNAQKRLDQAVKQKNALADQFDTLTLHMTSVEQEVTKCRKEKEDLMVDENILKLELRRLRAQLNEKADDIFTLEQRKLELDTAVTERREEISTHKAVLAMQLKQAQQARAKIIQEMKVKENSISLLKKRYEIQISTMVASDSDEPKSHAYLLVKAAQEKEELQNIGDELDANIRKAEKELRALENTLRLMNGRNTNLRRTLGKPDAEGSHAAEKEQLEAKVRTAMDKYKHRRREIKDLQEELSVLNETADELSHQENSRRRQLEKVTLEVAGIQRELDEQMEKKARARKQEQRMIDQLRDSRGEDLTMEEKEFQYQMLKEFNSRVMQSISSLRSKHPDVAPEIKMLFDRANLSEAVSKVERSTGTSVSSRSGRSSISSVASRRKYQGATANELVADRAAKKGNAVGTTAFSMGIPDVSTGAAKPTKTKKGTTSRPSSARSIKSASSVKSSRSVRSSRTVK